MGFPMGLPGRFSCFILPFNTVYLLVLQCSTAVCVFSLETPSRWLVAILAMESSLRFKSKEFCFLGKNSRQRKGDPVHV